MTANARHRTWFNRAAPAIVALGLCVSAADASGAGADGRLPSLPELPRISELVAIQQSSGLALDGIDPVSYFTSGRAVGGRAQFELMHNGIVWRFAGAANLSAFARNPEVYSPIFGGYDPVGVAGGRAVTSDPRFFLIADGVLLLFRSSQNKARWLAEPDLRVMAQRNWSTVEAQLVQ
ncbi:MAG: hypothetical protein NT037_05485 [Hyphomicrobiales bacterium]|jgi:hypothetical protein|nr:hypothetical protein [Hyphomicrobiales bacterium]